MRFFYGPPLFALACGPGPATASDGFSLEVVAEGVDRVDGLALAADGSILAAREKLGGGIVSVDPATGSFAVVAPGLDRPDNVLIDPTGVVYVTEENDDGRVVRIAGGRAETFTPDLVEPEGLDMDGAGNLYVAEHSPGGRVLRIDPSGVAVEIGRAKDGEGLRLLADGSILVAETSEDRLLRLAPDGSAEHLFGGEVSWPDGVGYDRASGRVFITEDVAGGRLLEADLDRRTLETVAFDLDAPQTVAFEPDGAILLAEQGRARILRIRSIAGAN
jgi:sugar lactone lactonase YvrE